MTENERFYTKESILTDGSVILDKEQKYTFPTLEHTTNFMFKKALNELNDECEFLEIENESLEDGAQKYVELYHKSLKENEQLKQTIEEMIKIFNDSGLDYVLSDEMEEILNDL